MYINGHGSLHTCALCWLENIFQSTLLSVPDKRSLPLASIAKFPRNGILFQASRFVGHSPRLPPLRNPLLFSSQYWGFDALWNSKIKNLRESIALVINFNILPTPPIFGPLV